MDEVQQLASLIRQLQGALGGRVLAAGVQVLTWPGSSPFTNAVSVPHGLKEAPLGVFALGNISTNIVFPYAGVPGPTTFTLSGWCPNASPTTGSHENVVWVAVG